MSLFSVLIETHYSVPSFSIVGISIIPFVVGVSVAEIVARATVSTESGFSRAAPRGRLTGRDSFKRERP